MLPRLNVYNAYRGEEYIGTGTKYELSKLLGVLPETVRHYASNSCAKQRAKVTAAPHRIYVLKSEDDRNNY